MLLAIYDAPGGRMTKFHRAISNLSALHMTLTDVLVDVPQIRRRKPRPEALT